MRSFILGLLIAALFQCGYCVVYQDCECGKESDEGLIILNLHGQRIVNGTEVRPHKYPWMAVMMKGWQHICGGSIISDKNIITAGHCVFYIPYPKNTNWIVGSHSIRASSRHQANTYKTLDFKLHPKFKSGRMFDNYDMAVIVTDRPIVFGPTVAPVCLPNLGDDELFWNRKVTVTGWGRTAENGPPTDVLMETHVFLKSQNDCKRLTTGIKYDPQSMVCAHERFTDACQGDSGGPLFADKATNFNVLLGVVSFGDGCARDFPGIYSKVPEEDTLKWIYSLLNMSEGNLCKNPSMATRQYYY